MQAYMHYVHVTYNLLWYEYIHVLYISIEVGKSLSQSLLGYMVSSTIEIPYQMAYIKFVGTQNTLADS